MFLFSKEKNDVNLLLMQLLLYNRLIHIGICPLLKELYNNCDCSYLFIHGFTCGYSAVDEVGVVHWEDYVAVVVDLEVAAAAAADLEVVVAVDLEGDGDVDVDVEGAVVKRYLLKILMQIWRSIIQKLCR